MKNSTYWANRFKALEDRQYRKSAAFVEGLKAKFDYADDELETSLYKWYSKLMKNTDAPSLNDAKKLLKENELKEFHWTLEQYEKYAKEHGLDPEWIKKLENASARKHISRYEQIQLQMRQIEEKLYAEYNNECYGYLGELVEDSYYHTAYEIEKGTGIGIDLHKLDRDTVEKYLTHPWCQDGKVFSDRIWQRKDELVRTLDQELTRQLITGADPQKAIDAISDKFDVSKHQAGTLVMTESAAIASEASKDSMKNLGVEEYEILATLDSHTSEICQEMDGQHFRMSEYNPGLTAPPFHPNCRSTTIPYFDDELTIGETRAARDKNDKDYERVPADMKYGEWKERFVVDNDTATTETSPAEHKEFDEQVSLLKKYGNLTNLMLNGSEDDLKRWNELYKITGKTERELLLDLSKEADNWEDILKMQSPATMEKFIDQLYDNATDQELGALNIWTGETYANIQRYLRYGINVDEISKSAAHNIENILNKLETPQEIIVRRGTGTSQMFEHIVGDWKKDPSVLIGQEFHDKGFTATSPFSDGGFSGAGESQAELFIRVPKGTHGAYIAQEAHNELEKEFLLQKGYTYHIIKAEYRSNPIFPDEKDLKVWCEVILK